MHHFEKIREYIRGLNENGISIETQKEPFKVKPVFASEIVVGVEVSNLGNSPFLPMEVFVVVISLLSLSKDGWSDKGDAMNCKLGDEGLKFDSVEGHVAKVIYGKAKGDSVFRRITPISKILERSGICENGRGYLKLIS